MRPADDLLATLRHELLRALPELLPGRDAERIAGYLVERTGCIAGHRLPTARGVELPDLESASQHYMLLAREWAQVLAGLVPDAIMAPTVARLLDVARNAVGGEYIPRGTAHLAERDARMWDEFRGDITATALAHGISYQRARQILTRRMHDERVKRQGSLF